MSLTVGVLTHRSARTLPALIESLPAGLAGVPGYRLVIGDSGSDDGTAGLARRLAPDAKIIELGANLGFAAAANAAVAADPDADAVLLLSPRVRLRPGCARAMLDTLARTGAGIVVPRLFGGTGEARQSLRHRPSVTRALAAALVGGTLAARLGPRFADRVADPRAYRRETVADWATGAVTMVSRACLAATGPWDESFFLYSEEVEFALRAADHGFRLVLSPDAQAVHLGGESRTRADLYGIQVANRVRLHAMREGGRRATPHWLAVLLGEAIRGVSPSGGIHRYATGKLLRERAALTAGRPALLDSAAAG